MSSKAEDVKLELLLRNTMISGLLSIVAASCLTLSMYGTIHFQSMLWWILLIAVILLARNLYFYRKIRIEHEQGIGSYKKHYTIVVIFLFVSGMLWGGGAYVFFPTTSEPELLVTFITIISVITAGIMPSFAPSILGYLAFMIPAITGVSIRVYQMEFYIVFTGSLIYIAYMTLGILRIAKVSTDSINIGVKNEQLLAEVRLAKEKADQANFEKSKLLEKKNNLIVSISHEFRTPLTLIVGPVDRVANLTTDRTIKQSLSIVTQNAKRLLRMVDQILALARLDNTKVSEEPAVVLDFCSLVEHISSSMHSLFDNKNILLTTNVCNGGYVQISHSSAEKIIINLLSNAAKYTPMYGSVDVSVVCSHDSLVLTVKDTGFGVAEEYHESIFDRFFRLDNPNTQTVSGAGVGLALVKELVEHYEGSIVLHSAEGEGAAFVLTFPQTNGLPAVLDVKTEEQLVSENLTQEIAVLKDSTYLVFDEAAYDPVESQDASLVETNVEKPLILIIEDDADIRAFIGSCFDDTYVCCFAVDGRDGVNKAFQLVPDLVITDLMMPHKDGYEVAKILRGDTRTSHIPIIMLTARADHVSRLQAWKLNIDEYIEKPFNIEALCLRTANLLNIRKIISDRLNDTRQSSGVGDVKSRRYVGVNNNDQQFIEHLELFIAKHLTNSSVDASELASEVGMSERQLNRKMQALLGQGCDDYLRIARLRKAAKMLMQGDRVSKVGVSVGFASQSYFSNCFKARYGQSPTEYQKLSRQLVSTDPQSTSD